MRYEDAIADVDGYEDAVRAEIMSALADRDTSGPVRDSHKRMGWDLIAFDLEGSYPHTEIVITYRWDGSGNPERQVERYHLWRDFRYSESTAISTHGPDDEKELQPEPEIVVADVYFWAQGG